MAKENLEFNYEDNFDVSEVNAKTQERNRWKVCNRKRTQTTQRNPGFLTSMTQINLIEEGKDMGFASEDLSRCAATISRLPAFWQSFWVRGVLHIRVERAPLLSLLASQHFFSIFTLFKSTARSNSFK